MKTKQQLTQSLKKDFDKFFINSKFNFNHREDCLKCFMHGALTYLLKYEYLGDINNSQEVERIMNEIIEELNEFSPIPIRKLLEVNINLAISE